MTPIHWALVGLGVAALVALSYQADAQVITYRIHPDILTELQDRYPAQADAYWEDVKEAVRDALGDWTALNPDLIFTPSHSNSRDDVVIEWVDADYAWGVEYHDAGGSINRIGIDFDSPEPDQYGASLMNPDIVRFVMAHELGHALGLGHSDELGHLMYGVSHPKPDDVFDSKGYWVPRVTIDNFENVGGDRMGVSFHLKGYDVTDIDVMDVNGTQYVVAGAGEDGLHILNMSDPQRPALAGSYNAVTVDVEAVPGHPYIVLFDGEGFDVLDVSDPTDIVLAGTVSHPNKKHLIRNATVIEADGKPFAVTVSRGMLQQYDISDPYDIRRTGAYADDFGMLGVQHVQGVVRDGTVYALVDATYDGTLVFVLSADRNPALQRQHTDLDMTTPYGSTSTLRESRTGYSTGTAR